MTKRKSSCRARLRIRWLTSQALICCVAFLLCVLVACPFAPSALIDDWSYSDVALNLARSGHLHYNGWGGSWVLFQSLWGAVWIRLFGFSFDLLRMATVPFSLGFVLLVYALGRKMKLAPSTALFGALITGASPLFLPFAASFMTESYTSFFMVLCLYAAAASRESENPRLALFWLWVLAVSGIVGGSNRQTVWVAPLSLIPYLMWKHKQDRNFAVQGAAALAVCTALIAVFVIRLPQPYAPLAMPPLQLARLLVSHSVLAGALIADSLLACLLMTLPGLLCVVPLWRQLGLARLSMTALAAAIATAVLTAVFGIQRGLAPFLGNTLTPFGILDRGNECLGDKPVVLPLLLRIGLTWLLLSAAAVFGQLLRRRWERPRMVGIAPLIVFSCAYIPLLVPGAVVGFTFDRYVLPLLPVLVLAILGAVQRYISRVPILAWTCLVVFASYAVATTHDYFSSLRARASAAQQIERQGTPRGSISAGFEYDGWTQLEEAGTIRPVLYGEAEANRPDHYWFWKNATAVHPDYVAIYARMCDLPGNRLKTVPFRTWLPPFGRAVIVVRRSALAPREFGRPGTPR